MGIKYCIDCNTKISNDKMSEEVIRFTFGDPYIQKFVGYRCKRCKEIRLQKIKKEIEESEAWAERNRIPQWHFSYAWRT